MTESRRPLYKQIKFDRLEALSAHVRNGELGHKVFDFSTVNSTPDNIQPTACGTNGCAMGELPILFPDSWEFNGGLPELKPAGADLESLTSQVAEFFGLWHNEVEALFYPFWRSSTDVYDDDGRPKPHWTAFHCHKLPQSATRIEVADNIDAFITWHKANP